MVTRQSTGAHVAPNRSQSKPNIRKNIMISIEWSPLLMLLETLFIIYCVLAQVRSTPGQVPSKDDPALRFKRESDEHLPEYVRRWACKSRSNFRDVLTSQSNYAFVNYNSQKESSNNEEVSLSKTTNLNTQPCICPKSDCQYSTNASRTALSWVDGIVLSCLALSLLCRVITFCRWVKSHSTKNKEKKQAAKDLWFKESMAAHILEEERKKQADATIQIYPELPINKTPEKPFQ